MYLQAVRLCRRPLLQKHSPGIAAWYRSYYTAKARFTTLGSGKSPVSREIEVMIGEPHHSFVYVTPEIGNALKSAILKHLGTKASKDPETLALAFHHDSQRFVHESLPFPRVEIDRNLPRSKLSTGDVSPATLWLSPHWHPITLDGTSDAAFERESTKSAKALKGALDALKET